MSNIKKNTGVVLGGLSLKDKLSLARKELDNLQDGELNSGHNKVNSQIDEPAVKFHLTGRCNRKNNKYTTKAFYILDSLDRDIKLYCNGGDVAVFNYLIYLGLNEIKRRENHSFDEISSIEEPNLK